MKKKFLLVIFMAFVAAATWFATSYALGGQVKEWLSNEDTQIEQVQPEDVEEEVESELEQEQQVNQEG